MLTKIMVERKNHMENWEISASYERTPHEAPHHPPGVKMVMGDSLGSAAIAFRWAAEQALSSAHF